MSAVADQTGWDHDEPTNRPNGGVVKTRTGALIVIHDCADEAARESLARLLEAVGAVA